MTVETTNPPVASASGAASASAAPVETVSYRAGKISFIGLPIVAGAALLLIGLPVAGLIWFLRRKNTTGTGKAVAIGCGVLVLGGILVLMLLAGTFLYMRLHMRGSVVSSQTAAMTAAKAQAEAQMAEARARAGTASGQAKAKATPAFSPVVERDLTDDTMMDFESGQVEAPPDFVYSSDSTIVGNINSHIDWMKQKGFDFCFVSGEAICIGPKVMVLLPGDLTNLTARALMRQLALDKGGGPGACFIALRSRRAIHLWLSNALRSDGDTAIDRLRPANPRGVKIRYKLVQNDATNAKTVIQDDAAILSATKSPPDLINEEGVYVIASGDTVARIARRFGLSMADLMAMNPGLEPTRIKIGQRVRVARPTSAQLGQDFKARIAATAGIMAFPDRDEVLASIAQDAARAGDFEDARDALKKITAFPTRDEAICASARLLAAAGRRADALELAKLVTAFPTRDALISELAK